MSRTPTATTAPTSHGMHDGDPTRHARIAFDMIGAVLWDLDGTLVDSEGKHWLSWRDTMAAEGISITRDQFQATFGLRNDAIVPRWLPEGASPDHVRDVGDAKEVRYRKLVRQE